MVDVALRKASEELEAAAFEYGVAINLQESTIRSGLRLTLAAARFYRQTLVAESTIEYAIVPETVIEVAPGEHVIE